MSNIKNLFTKRLSRKRKVYKSFDPAQSTITLMSFLHHLYKLQKNSAQQGSLLSLVTRLGYYTVVVIPWALLQQNTTWYFSLFLQKWHLYTRVALIIYSQKVKTLSRCGSKWIVYTACLCFRQANYSSVEVEKPSIRKNHKPNKQTNKAQTLPSTRTFKLHILKKVQD